MMRLMRKSSKQSGLTLIELMVAIVVGSLLVIAAVYMFISSKRTYTQAERMMRINENGRYALTVVAEDLRHVDYWGNVRAEDVQRSGALKSISNDCTGNAAGYDLSTPLWSIKVTSAAVLGCITDAIPGSNALVIKHVAQRPTEAFDLKVDSAYVLANPVKAVLFNDFKKPPTNTPGGDVPKGKYWEYKSTIYYVRNNDKAVPSLFRLRLLNGTWSEPQEVAVGIERMTVEFGLDDNEDGSADVYVGADVADWSQVVSARVYLLVRSEQEDKTYTDTRTYRLGDATEIKAPQDNYHRMVFNTSVGLRNRRFAINGGAL